MKIRNGLVVFGRALRRLGRLIVAAPIELLRFLFSLPRRCARGLLWLLRFVFSLPQRFVNGLIWLLRFLYHLPGRLWRGLKALIRFIIGLPRRAIRGIQWLALELYRIRLRIRELRARFAFWCRSRVIRPRTLSPRAQGLSLMAMVILAAMLVWSGRQLRHLSSRAEQALVVTATPDRVDALPATPTPPAYTSAPPLPDSTSSLSSNPFGGGGAIAFSLRRRGNTDIYVRKLDDDQLLRLTYHRAEDREPVWAPDDETLAFVSFRGKNWDIYRLDLVSGALVRLTRHPHYDAHPSWSPDGAFIAFESYRSGNLDLFIMASDGSEIVQLTASQAADFAPSWSPDGRHIAFVSDRDGSKDIFLYPLDAGSEDAVTNLTQTPDRDEDSPTWSPDGSQLAFSVGRFGADTIYVTTFDWGSKYLDEAQVQLFNPGTRPDWSPDGSCMVYQYQRVQQAYLIAESVTGWEAGHEVYNSNVAPENPSWSAPVVDPQFLAQQRQTAPLEAASIYIEEILPPADSGPPYTIVALKDVNGGDDREFLSDRVDDSFAALRQRVLEETGVDYLATIGDSFRRIQVPPPPGQSPRSWHKAGRAFDLNQGLYEREEQLVELVREDIGFRTYWRIYLRVARQDGSLGKPLHETPWDLKARQAGGLAAREGGQLKQEVPLGYYVDFTELAADYGWERVPANYGWRHHWADINWWQYQKTQGLSWFNAMLELYRLDEIEAVFGPLSQQEP